MKSIEKQYKNLYHHFVRDQDELMIFLVGIAKKRYHIVKVEDTGDDKYHYHVSYYIS